MSNVVDALERENFVLQKHIERLENIITIQQTEIERWKNEAICYQDLWCEGMTDVQTAKSEAYKEFAERLKHGKYYDLNYCEWVVEVCVSEIDNLVKEMTEGKEK